MEIPPLPNHIETKANPSIAIPNSTVGYGRIESVVAQPYPKTIRRESFGDKLRFYFGEYVTGVLFILALSLFTLFLTREVANPIKYFGAMIDRICKKVIDYGGAIIGLLLSLPIFLIVPLLIKLDSRGPVFYSQRRVGQDRRRNRRRIYNADIDSNHRIRERRREDYNGQTFRVIKFRTMVSDAEAKTGAVWASKNDARITRLGKILRKTRIDEIPQLINILKGDMSLVGPRPERPVFVKDFSEKIPQYSTRLTVKPGITGLAQVSAGYDTSLDSVINKLQYDINYIRNWSIVSDIKILLKTVGVVLTGRGAC